MDKKVYANGNVTVWAIPRAAVADIHNIKVSEINSDGLDITDAISWSDTTLPTVSGSDDVDDRSIRDKGNATSRGASNFEASLSLFYPGDFEDVNGIYRQTWDVFKQTRVPLVLVVRVLQGEQGVHDPAEEGELYNAFYMLNSTYRNAAEGDNSVKYTVGFMAQGQLRINGLFGGAAEGTITVEEAPSALAVDESGPIRATAYGHRLGRAFRWRSSDTAVASVSRSGVVTGEGTGSATITGEYPGLEDATVEVTVA